MTNYAVSKRALGDARQGGLDANERDRLGFLHARAAFGQGLFERGIVAIRWSAAWRILFPCRRLMTAPKE